MTVGARCAGGTGADGIRSTLTARTPRSADIHRAAAEVLASEVVQTVDMPHPVYIESADGARMTDVDGNVYIDLAMGFGPHVLGHRPRAVVEAMARQLERGWHVGLHNPWQERLARLIVEAGPCVDSVVFCNSGTEATMYAMRAARAFTGKSKVGVFDGAYHGAHDYALVKVDGTGPRTRPRPVLDGEGVPTVIRDDTMVVLPFLDEAAFELIREHRDGLALVVVQPVQNNNPRLDAGDWLYGLCRVCRDNDVLCLFDEVVTGFRIAYGGAQEHFRVTPDLAVYGKAIGGGLPIGAVGGRQDVMASFGVKRDAGGIFFGGTFNGNPLAMVAGLAAAGEMKEKRETLYPHLTEQGDRLAHSVNRFCAEQEIPSQMLNAGSMLHLHFQADEIRSYRDLTRENAAAETEFYLHLLGHGVIIPGIHLAFLSGAHTVRDVDTVIDAVKQSLLDVRRDGLI